MKKKHPAIAILCVLILVAAPLPVVGQSGGTQPSQSSGGWFSGIIRPYRYRQEPAIDLSNSNRLESLLRAGSIYLSLQDAIALALENNLDIELQRFGPRIADSDILRAKAGGLLRGVPTSVTSGPSSALAQATGTAGGRAAGGSAGGGGTSGSTSAGGAIITTTGTSLPNLDPVFTSQLSWGHRTVPQTNSFTTGTNALVLENTAANFSLSQGFLTGTNVQLGFNNSPLTTNSSRNDFNPSITGNFSLLVTQRLLQGFGIAVNNRNIRIARNDRKVSDLVFRQQVIATVSSIIGLYWDLVSFNEDVKVKKQAVALAEKLYNDNKKQVEIGTLAPIEIVRAEAEVASSQQALTAAETQVLQQETIIKNALSRTGVASPTIAEAHIIPTDQIKMPEHEPIEPVQDLVSKALENRPELAQTRIQVENTKIGIRGDKSALRPALDMFATLQNNGLAGILQNPNANSYFVGGWGTVMGQIFRRNFPDYSVGVQLNVPLRNRAAQADMIRDQLSLRQQEIREQQQINQIRVDVRNALIGIQQARASYQAAVKARILQEQTLDAEQKKYALGASTIFFVIQAQRDLAQARSVEVAALSTYSKAKVQLDQATGQTLEAYNISIDEAMSGRVSRPPSPIPALPQK